MPKGVYLHKKGWIGLRGEKNGRWMGGIESLNPKKYYQEYLKAYWPKYRKENQGKIKHNRFLHRERLKNAVGSFTLKEWEELKKKYDYSCAGCGTSEGELLNKIGIGLTKDHIFPLSRGGTNYILNIQPLCMDCNRHKHARI